MLPSPSESSSRTDRIADYLDHLCTPLVGILPYDQRQALRWEVEDHLYGLIAEYEEQALSPSEATDAALKEYGEPWKIGEAYLDSYRSQLLPGVISRHWFLDKAPLTAFAFFGIGSSIAILLLQWMLLPPKPGYILPIALTVLVIAAPVIAGCAVGYIALVRPARAVVTAMLPILIHTLAVSIAMLPATQGIDLLAVQLLYWLPAGAACATLTSSLRRHRQRNDFFMLRRLISPKEYSR